MGVFPSLFSLSRVDGSRIVPIFTSAPGEPRAERKIQMNASTLALLADSGLGMVERAIVVLPSADVLMGEDHDAHVLHFDSFVGSRYMSDDCYDYSEISYSDEFDSSDYCDGYTRCPRHPSEIISNGMFDAPCGGCEHEMEHSPEADYADFLQGIAAHFSRICNDGAKGDDPPASWDSGPWQGSAATCVDTFIDPVCFEDAASFASDNIPF